MSPIDLGLLAVIILFTVMGLFFGFIRTAGSLLGTIITMGLLFLGYDLANQWFGGMFSSSFFTQATFFVVAFFVVSKLVGIVIWGLVKALHLLKMFPFVGIIDRLGGLVLGLLEGLLFAAVGTSFLLGMATQLFTPEQIQSASEASVLLPLFLWAGTAIALILPESMRMQFTTP
jgi:membrane protein required for colicin V production